MHRDRDGDHNGYIYLDRDAYGHADLYIYDNPHMDHNRDIYRDADPG